MKLGYVEYTRRCKRCNDFYKSNTEGSHICNKCKLPCGGLRGRWQKGKHSSLLYMKELGIL